MNNIPDSTSKNFSDSRIHISLDGAIESLSLLITVVVNLQLYCLSLLNRIDHESHL